MGFSSIALDFRCMGNTLHLQDLAVPVTIFFYLQAKVVLNVHQQLLYITAHLLYFHDE